MNESKLKERTLYNPDSKETITDRKVFGGNPSGIINANDIKYQWAFSLWERMLNNTWFTKEVNMVADAKDYKILSDTEKSAYDKALSQLIFMDSLQTVNIGKHIQPYITAPEIDICLVRQAFEEALHSFSYAVMVDSISANGNEIYNMFKVDPVLKRKNEYIANTYTKLGENPSEKNFLLSLFANTILEGIYFYSGFAYIYTLARSGKMLNSAQMIRFIQRDEVTHLELFTNTILEIYKERPDLFTAELYEEVYTMFKEAVALEIEWGVYITNGQVLGLTNEIVSDYIKYLADQRIYNLRNAGFKKIYNVEHPIKWVDNFAKFNDQKTNFFEGTVTNYSKKNLAMEDF